MPNPTHHSQMAVLFMEIIAIIINNGEGKVSWRQCICLLAHLLEVYLFSRWGGLSIKSSFCLQLSLTHAWEANSVHFGSFHHLPTVQDKLWHFNWNLCSPPSPALCCHSSHSANWHVLNVFGSGSNWMAKLAALGVVVFLQSLPKWGGMVCLSSGC